MFILPFLSSMVENRPWTHAFVSVKGAQKQGGRINSACEVRCNACCWDGMGWDGKEWEPTGRAAETLDRQLQSCCWMGRETRDGMPGQNPEGMETRGVDRMGKIREMREPECDKWARVGEIAPGINIGFSSSPSGGAIEMRGLGSLETHTSLLLASSRLLTLTLARARDKTRKSRQDLP